MIKRRRHNRILALIALLRLGKALVLVLLGMAALEMMRPDVRASLVSLK